MGATPLTTRIPVKDRDGRVIDEKEVATYAGLLARAHEEGLSAITTRLLQAPRADNGETAIVEATVTTGKGAFAGIGDASPANVSRKVAAHVIRMAETRAKARALRDAVNIGTVSLEELGGEDVEEDAPLPSRRETGRPQLRDVSRPPDDRRAADRRPAQEQRREPPPAAGTGPARMTDNQRRYLYRYLAERGFEGQAATDAICRAAEVDDVARISKQVASEIIAAWKEDEGRAA